MQRHDLDRRGITRVVSGLVMLLAGEATAPAIGARFGAPGSAKAVLEVKKSVTRTGATARRLKPRRSSGQSLYQNSETGESFGACRLRPPPDDKKPAG